MVLWNTSNNNYMDSNWNKNIKKILEKIL
jgi:hypothetical protein